MTYILVRAVIAAIGFGITCMVMWRTWPEADATAFETAGGAWAFALTIYLGYLHKLRRDTQDWRVAEAERNLAALREMGRRMREASSATPAAASEAAAAHPLHRAA